MRAVRAECRRAAGTLCSICGCRDVLSLDRTDDHDFNSSRACRDKHAPRSSWPGLSWLVPAIHAVSGLEPRTGGGLLEFGGEVIVEGAALGRGVEVARRREMVIAGLSCPTSLAQGMSIAA